MPATPPAPPLAAAIAPPPKLLHLSRHLQQICPAQYPVAKWERSMNNTASLVTFTRPKIAHRWQKFSGYGHLWRAVFPAFFLITAACDTNNAGSGLTLDGAPIVVTIQGTAVSKGFSTATIRSPQGWVCTGQFTSKDVIENPLTFQFPLACTNGSSGTAILTFNPARGRLTGTLVFSLSNGEQGSAQVDMV